MLFCSIRYVQMLSTLQEHVSSLTAEGAACREEVSEIAADFQTFQKCVKTFAAGQVGTKPVWPRLSLMGHGRVRQTRLCVEFLGPAMCLRQTAYAGADEMCVLGVAACRSHPWRLGTGRCRAAWRP